MSSKTFNHGRDSGQSQNSYLRDKPRTIVNDRFGAMTLSHNPELWQSLPAEKQHELENTPELPAIEEELEQVAVKFKDDSVARDRRNELHAQKRKLMSEEIRRCQKLQPKKQGQKSEQVGHYLDQFSRTRQLNPQRRHLANDLFAVGPNRSENARHCA